MRHPAAMLLGGNKSAAGFFSVIDKQGSVAGDKTFAYFTPFFARAWNVSSLTVMLDRQDVF